MRSPFKFDFSPTVLGVLATVVVAAALASAVSLFMALRKKEGAASHGALMLGMVALAVGVCLCCLAGWHDDAGLFSLGVVIVPPLSVLAIVSSLRERTSLPAVVAALGAFLVSPVVIRHSCGLSSWPLEWLIAAICMAVSFVVVLKARRRWLAWTLTGLALVGSFSATRSYLNYLHLPTFPNALLDRSGREWRSRYSEPKPKP